MVREFICRNPKHKNPNPKKIQNSKDKKDLRFHKHRRKKAMLWASTVTYVAGTHDRKTLRVYINATQKGSAAYTDTQNIFVGNDDLSIGGLVGGTSPGSVSSPFHGLVDEVGIDNQALPRGSLHSGGLLDIFSKGSGGRCGTGS